MTARTTTAGNAANLPTVQKTIEEPVYGKSPEKNVKDKQALEEPMPVCTQWVRWQVFLTETQLDSENLRKALNSTLPRDISIIKAPRGSGRLSLRRFSSRSKIYEYRIFNRPHPPALQRNRVWHIQEKLDTKKMREAAAYLEGTHDFSVFATANITVKTTVRTVKWVHIKKTPRRDNPY